jgi:vacuolar-type H+-ATPase subunit H
MRDVIQKVMAAEHEAKQLVEAARAEAVGFLSAAQNQAREQLETSRRVARAEAQQILADADASAQHEKSAQLNRAIAEIRATIRLDETTRQAAVAAGLRVVCGGNQEARP